MLLPEQESTPSEEPASQTAEVPEPEDTETDDSQPAPAAAQTDIPRPSRRDRRAARVDVESARREAEESRRALAEERQQREQLAQQVAEMRGYLAHQSQGQKDPAEVEAEAVLERAEAHLHNASTTQDPAVAKRELRAYHMALKELSSLEARSAARDETSQAMRQAPDPAMIGMKTTLESEYSWLSSNKEVRARADAIIEDLTTRKQNRRPHTLATYREACAMAAAEYGLGGNGHRPTERQRAAYGGIGSGEGGGGGGSEDRSVPFGDDEERMASAAFPHLDPEKAKTAWLKRAGQAILGARKK